MLADLWIDQFDEMRLEAFVRAFLIRYITTNTFVFTMV
jgi:hypothetical protein